jgi:hypothetical protein
MLTLETYAGFNRGDSMAEKIDMIYDELVEVRKDVTSLKVSMAGLKVKVGFISLFIGFCGALMQKYITGAFK